MNDDKIIIDKKCRYCKSTMNIEAKVCPSCNGHQNIFVKNIFNITTLLSIAVVIIAFLQFDESRRDREETSLALSKADSSLNAANIALKHALFAEKQINLTSSELQGEKFNISQVLLHSIDESKFTPQDYFIGFTNEKQVDAHTYEFDVILKSTGEEFELTTYQCAIAYNRAVSVNTEEKPYIFTYINGSSELTNIPQGLDANNFNNINRFTFAASQIARDMINNKEKKIGRFRIHGKVPFRGSDLNLNLDFSGKIGTILVGSSYSIIVNKSNITTVIESDEKLIVAEIKVFLEGAYNKNSMNTTLSNSKYIPLSQPYGTVPWKYFGSERANKIPEDVVDWILIELRANINSTSVIARRAAFIKRNGIVTDLDGKGRVSFINLKVGNYYLVIKHRNHLSIMSSNPIYLSTKSTLYDFSTGQNKAYGSEAMINLSNNFCMYAGDGNADDIINVLDYVPIGNSLLSSGYNAADLDMNGTVDIIDYVKTNNNLIRKSQVP